MAGVLSGISAYGHAIGVGSSYGAFMAPLGHIAARLHAIGAEARLGAGGEPYRSLILICGHAGLATGEDGPTHADPQALQLLQENFPTGTAITLTPWEPQEIWPLLATALAQRPALIAPFVTRPEVKVLDRSALGLARPEEATTGVYLLRRRRGTGDVTIVLQESAVTYAFVTETLPLLESDGIDPRVYYVASAELFDALPLERRHALFPEAHRSRPLASPASRYRPCIAGYAPTPAARRLSIRTARATISAAARPKSCSARPASTAPPSSPRSRSTWTPRFAQAAEPTHRPRPSHRPGSPAKSVP